MFGSPEGSGSLQQARNLNRTILENKDKNNWTLQYVYAGVSVLWLGEYSGWYLDNQGTSPLVGVNLDDGNPKNPAAGCLMWANYLQRNESDQNNLQVVLKMEHLSFFYLLVPMSNLATGRILHGRACGAGCKTKSPQCFKILYRFRFFFRWR